MPRYYGEKGRELEGLREARKVRGFPSVTTVINSSAPHEYKYLEDKKLYDAINFGWTPQELLEELGNNPVFEQGHIVHEAAQVFFSTGLKSVLLECPKSSREFYKILGGLKPDFIEEFFRSKGLETGGRVDLVATPRDGGKIIYDYKTASQIKKKPLKSWIVQMGAYYSALLENNIWIDGAVIVQFGKKNQGCTEISINKETLLEGAATFSHIRESFKFYHEI